MIQKIKNINDKIRTNIYHITQFSDNSVYLHFFGCNWKCKGCVRLQKWDTHLSPSDRENLNKIYPESKANLKDLRLNLHNVIKILKENNVKKVYLGGHEPTIDPNIVSILEKLKEEGLWIKLITNGQFLNTEIMDRIDKATLSIKAIDDKIHKSYTGMSNKRTLKNFEKFCNSGKIEVESIYIPDVVECEEILKIAEYIARHNKNLRYRIDRYLYSGYGRDAAEEEVERCFKKVKEILPNAYTFASRWGKAKGYAKCLYPKI